MDFQKALELNVRASAPIIQIISNETLRIRASSEQVANALQRNLYRWNRAEGLLRVTDSSENSDTPEADQPHEVLELLSEFKDEGDPSLEMPFILLLEDFHHSLTDIDHALISRLRSFAIAVAGRSIKDCTIIMSQPIPHLPTELEKEVQVLDMPLPSVEDLRKILQQAKQRYGIDDDDYSDSAELLEAALGLSTSEAQLAFAKAACEHRRLNERIIPDIVDEKEQVIRKSGHLEYFHPKSSLDDIGGLDNLKSWLNRRRQAFTKEARDFGLEIPRGVLLLGLPGTGKSLAAKAVAHAWQLPLLRLDMGKIYGGIVGQSEANIRSALQTAEALAPSILWVDEIEKGLSGLQSSGSTDGGTTSRVLGTFLTWMQEKEKPVFVVATANHIELLPPELLRKGRVDEIFFVDLPVQRDRKEILSIHLKRRNRQDDFSDDELEELAEASKGFTGAELEEAVKEGMFLAFDSGHHLGKDDLLRAIKTTTPLSQTMAEVIQKTRSWAEGRAVAASSSEPETLTLADIKDKKPRLKQEGENPFI
jgi:ATP-dependent 26S proteasome regulatory subunit